MEGVILDGNLTLRESFGSHTKIKKCPKEGLHSLEVVTLCVDSGIESHCFMNLLVLVCPSN